MPSDKLIQQAKDLFKECAELTSDWRKKAEDDIRFASGDQWPAELRAWRESQNLPCLTIDRLEGPISQLVGDQRQNDLACKVIPRSLEGRKLVTAEKRQIDEGEFVAGLVRDIQRRSRFEWTQAQAFEHAVVCGMGGWYMDTTYVGPDSFEQRIVIRGIESPIAIYPDIKGFGTDEGMAYAYIIEDHNEEAFKRQFPKASTAWEEGDDWASTDAVRTALWWYKERVADTVLQLRHSDGRMTTILKSELGDTPLPTGVQVARERKSERVKIMRRVMSSLEVLEETEWPGTIIPVAIVLGKRAWVGGRLDLQGIVRKGMDPQRLYNYNRSTVAEIMGAAPKAPYLLTPSQVNGLEQMWKTANTGNKPYLLYNPDPHAPGAPQRQQLAYPQGFANEAIVAASDVMSVTKIHEASLGQRSNETSGIAIQARQREGDTGNYVYTDNLLLAVEETGRIIVDAIPRVYDSTRLLTSRAQDGTVTSVELNKPTPGGVQNRLSGGYDTEVTAGPAFGTARQEAVQAMTALGQAAPNLLAAGADIWVGNMDWPGADQLAARLKKMVPPELLDEQDQDDAGVKVAQLSQAVQMLEAKLQETMQAAQQAGEEGAQAQQDVAKLTHDLQVKDLELRQAKAELALTKQEASTTIDGMRQEEKLRRDFEEAKNALRDSVPVPEPEPVQPPDFSPVLQALAEIKQSLGNKEPAQPVQVIVETGEKPKVKRGKAIKQPDGSWSMEVLEQEVGEP